MFLCPTMEIVRREIAMIQIEFVRERLHSHVGENSDLTMLQRRYKVEGHDDLLVMTTYFDDAILEMVPGWLERQRKQLDEEAQFTVDEALQDIRPLIVEWIEIEKNKPNRD